MKIPTGITFPLLLKRNILLNQPAGSNADGQDTPKPPDNKEPRPRLIIHVQRDAKNGGKSITATKYPFNKPIKVPTTAHATKATPTGIPLCTIKYPPNNA